MTGKQTTENQIYHTFAHSVFYNSVINLLDLLHLRFGEQLEWENASLKSIYTLLDILYKVMTQVKSKSVLHFLKLVMLK